MRTTPTDSNLSAKASTICAVLTPQIPNLAPGTFIDVLVAFEVKVVGISAAGAAAHLGLLPAVTL